ncbi:MULTISPECIES: efflux RND transporter permease subunit [unclassified Oceanispirochaeta]|uniref:efflux RND transporter permease subunit n=1 Tax=unclassified Oceanispirochaeta TaxID=2635722 RepID=UPI000E08D29E|nr:MULTISPECIES: efflux RND transporter permease subunit [unclassified Oceanispirochaeta]MBF9014701.1 efflux RND transporter permease subunit [Oceanispirochaeta sp. M2]NPD70957.1 efflux RND transporter permease subunit [Oceanispirochaeta sp. M1]RDG33790.1 AcrB/AcrD/AcrF family protein [Oceanispirochaeta sp. M1]
MRKLVNFFVNNSLLTNWLMILIFAAGTFGLINLQKRIWPKIEFDYISVELSWYGASAMEVEDGLVLPLEERLRGVEGVVQVTSTARDGGAWFGLETSPWHPMDKTLDKVRQVVETTSLPDDAEKPVVYQETEWNRVMLLFLYGPDDLSLLEDVAEEFREDLIRSGQVTQINTWGFPGEQIILEPAPSTLERYSLSLDDIDRAVRASSLNLSAGSVLTSSEQIQIRTYEKKTTIPELENIAVKNLDNGRILLLKDICEIRRGRAENALYTRANGQDAIGFQIMYGNTEDVIAISKMVDLKLAEYSEKYKDQVTFQTYIRDVDELHERLGTLTKSGLGGLLLVLLVLGLFLNTRISFWVALGIPISFLGLIFIEWVMKITINEMSLFGMIMIIGILVDDGIVIGESIYDHWHRLGKPRAQAAVDGTMDVLAPVLISIATTIVAFAPYFFIYGEMGKYTSQIGLVVIISLLFSLVEAIILLPAHLAHSKAMTEEARIPGKFRARLQSWQDYLINRIYAPFLDFSLAHKGVILSLLAGSLMISVGAVAGNHIEATFFPDIEAPYVYAELSFPSGTTADVVNETRRELEEFAMEFGKSWADENGAYDNAIVDYLSWGNNTQLWVYLILQDNKIRDFSVNEFSLALARELPENSVLESAFIGNDAMFGGDPVYIRFLGKNDEDLRAAADLFKERLKTIEGVKDIRDDTPLGQKEFLIHLNNRGKALGLTTADVSNQVRMGFYGNEIMSIQEGRNEVPLIVRYPQKDRASLSDVENLQIITPAGSMVPFKEVADFSLRRSQRRIRRENGYRALSVMAGIDAEKAELNVVMKEINEVILPDILAQVEGVTLSQGGQAEMVNKMIKSMAFSMAMALLIMFTLLLFQMKSWGQALLVLSLIPLGFLGAVYGHIIMGKPISFISFLGSVALGGIIVNDSVVLIDCFNKKLRAGIPRAIAIREAALQRFRPIIMTTLTTSIGLTPLIFQKSVGGQMLVPIGISIAWGLLFGTFLTLAVLPVVLGMMKNKSDAREEPAIEDENEEKENLSVLNAGPVLLAE